MVAACSNRRDEALQLLAAMLAETPRGLDLRKDRRRGSAFQATGLSPLALLAACGGGGAASTPPPPSITAAADSMSAIAGAAVATGNVLANDTATGGAATVTAVAIAGEPAGTPGQPMQGSLGSLTIAADGAATFTVADNAAVRALGAGQTATNSFTYTAAVGSAVAAPQTVTVTVTGTNDAPVAVPDVATISADATSNVVDGNVLTNDTDVDAGTTLRVIAVGGGTVGDTLRGTYGSIVVSEDGTYVYTLDRSDADTGRLRAGQSGTDSFSYVISDGNLSSTASLTITVNGGEDPPVAAADSGAVTAGAAANTARGNVLANDSDPDAGTTLSVVNISGGIVGTPYVGTYGSIVIRADGSYVYTLNNSDPDTRALPAGQTATERFTYEVGDGTVKPSGVLQKDSAVLTITVTGANDNPVAVNDTGFTITEDSTQATVGGNVLANDSDPDPGTTLRVSAVNGAALPQRQTSTYGELDMNADGSFVYTLRNSSPAVQQLLAGQRQADSFTYTVIDGSGGQATATLAITVIGTADFPSGTTLVNDTISLTASRTIAASEVLGRSVPGTLLSSGSVDYSIVNRGQMLVETGAGDGTAYGGANLETLTNFGTISVSTTAGTATGFYAGSWGMLLNHGDVIVRSDSGGARGYVTWNPGSSSWSRTVTEHLNSDLIDVRSNSGIAAGVVLVNGGRFVNDAAATLRAEGFGARALEFNNHGGTLVNRGTIVAESSNAASPAQGVVGHFAPTTDGSPQIDNSGLIRATIAIKSEYYFSSAVGGGAADFVRNSGTIEGNIDLFGNDDRLLNSGIIRGDIFLRDGNDIFEVQLATSQYTGVADGGAGTDTFRIIDNAGASITPAQLDIGAILENFEAIDLAGTGNTTLAIRVSDVIDATGQSNQLLIGGATGDRVDLDESWARQADQTVSGDSYHVYTSGNATLLVDADILVI